MPDGNGHLLFVWTPSGYLLRECDGDPPPVGFELDEGGRVLVITKVGTSPLPGDGRLCAYSVSKS